MNEYKNLYKLIDNLNLKIKNLESNKIKSSSKNLLNKKLNQNNLNTLIESYRIHHSKENQTEKKYVGLMFDNNFNNFDSEDNTGNKNLCSFIKLKKSNIIINYSIQLELNYTPISSVICSLALGIRSKSDSKIKIIKGTKYQFDLTSTDVINNKITINNTILYCSASDEELCMIVDVGSNCFVNNKKSIIKLLYIY
jgi:hypothetical protein